MRCPDCNKFVSLYTDGDPEVELEVDETTGEVTGTVRIVNACQECGVELTEATFDVDVDFPATEKHLGDLDPETSESGNHELELLEPEATRTERSVGKGRGTKTFYGAEADLVVKCSCGFAETQHWSDDIQASYMDSLN